MGRMVLETSLRKSPKRPGVEIKAWWHFQTPGIVVLIMGFFTLFYHWIFRARFYNPMLYL